MRVYHFDGPALWICAERPACGWPGFRTSTATYLAHCRAYGRATGRALSVRGNLRYGGLQRLAEDEVVPAPYSPDLNPIEQDSVALKKRREYQEQATRDDIVKAYQGLWSLP